VISCVHYFGIQLQESPKFFGIILCSDGWAILCSDGWKRKAAMQGTPWGRTYDSLRNHLCIETAEKLLFV